MPIEKRPGVVGESIDAAESLTVRISYPDDGQQGPDDRPSEVKVNRYLLPRVGELITWDDSGKVRRVIEVHHDFPSYTSDPLHVVTLVVEDE
jgi:hypothetical protein